MLSLGIPPNAIMALMIGAMMIHGITPGPEIITKQPALFWGMVVSMLIGNVMLVILNLPLIGCGCRLLRIPYRVLFPTILVFCCIGTYTVEEQRRRRADHGDLRRDRIRDAQARLRADAAAAGLGPGADAGREFPPRHAGRRAATSAVFVTRPISLGFLLASAALLGTMMVSGIRKRRGEVFRDA